MFCSNCGKEISIGNICSKCGMKSEPLRAFKKLDLPVKNNQENQPQNTEIIREKVIYKSNPRQRKYICMLTALVITFALISIVALIYSYKANNKLKELQSSEQFPISENSYNISGSIERDDNDYAFISLTDTLNVDINNKHYKISKIYLSPDIYIEDINADIEGKIYKLSDDVFMIIQN